MRGEPTKRISPKQKIFFMKIWRYNYINFNEIFHINLAKEIDNKMIKDKKV